MKYTAAKFTITCQDEVMESAKDLLAASAAEAGFEAFEDMPRGITGYVQDELLDKIVLDKSIEDFPIEGVEITYTLEKVPDTNWNATWEENGFEPIDINGKVLVFDAKKPLPAESGSWKVLIGIEAQMAFGTGTHETTRMVVEVLTEMDLSGKRILDCGCGTGILGIAALKLGAEQVVGYDIDEWAVNNTLHNAEINRVKELSVFHGNSSVLSHVNGVFDVVMANINRNILMEDMHHFKDVLSSDGTLIISGFYKNDAAMLEQEAKRHGLSLTEGGVRTNDDWCCLVFKNS